MKIPTHKEWLEKTYVIAKPRGQALKEVDHAIKVYEEWQKTQTGVSPGKEAEEAKLVLIKNALNRWKSLKGPDWRNSDRNKKSHVVAQLDYELSRIGSVSVFRDAKEREAWKYLIETRQNAIKTLFTGMEVTFKLKNLKGELNTLKGRGPNPAAASQWHDNPLYEDKTPWQNNPLYVPPPNRGVPIPKRYPAPTKPGQKIQPVGMGKDGKIVVPSMSGLPKSPQDAKIWAQARAESIVKQIFNVENVILLGSLATVVLGIVKLALVDIAPVIGHVKDGVGMVKGVVDTAHAFYKANDICQKQYAIDIGHPDAAFGALRKLLIEEARNASIELGMDASAFAAKTALLAADFGAASQVAVGLVKAFAEIIFKVTLLAIEYNATKAANKLLDEGILDIRLFKTYPLMGCYFLRCADTSTVMPIDCFGLPGWMDAIERMKRKGFDEICKTSEELIKKSPWQIAGMPKTRQEAELSIRKIIGTVISVGGLAVEGAEGKDLGGG